MVKFRAVHICAKVALITFGAIASLFYASKFADIFASDPSVVKKLPIARRIHEMWFNLVGCAVGWIATYYFIFGRILSPSFTFEAKDIFLVLIALLGITGYLPFTLSKMNSLK